MEKGFFNRAYLKEGEGDSRREANRGVSGKYRPRDIIKDTYNKSNKTKSSGSEVGPKYLTDKGSPILIEGNHHKPIGPEQQVLRQRQLKQMFEDKGKWISDRDPSYNCHSYVFTDGKAGWISDRDAVEKIIKENGFKEIASAEIGNNDYTYTQLPKEGDIIIYRDEDNEPIHSSIIIKSDNDPKNIVVRSKMGTNGIFEHSALIDLTVTLGELEVTHWEIYHTDRLQGRVITEASRE